jgi:hypothetical protein
MYPAVTAASAFRFDNSTNRQTNPGLLPGICVHGILDAVAENTASDVGCAGGSARIRIARHFARRFFHSAFGLLRCALVSILIHISPVVAWN